MSIVTAEMSPIKVDAVLDVLSLDSLLWAFFGKKYRSIGYCRVTLLGNFLVKFSPFNKCFVQLDDDLNERMLSERRLTEEFRFCSKKIADHVDGSFIKEASRSLSIDQIKFEGVCRSHISRFSFYQVEPYYRAKIYGVPLLADPRFEYPYAEIDTYNYKTRFDLSRIVDRKYYIRDKSGGQPGYRWLVQSFGLLGLYILSVITLPFVAAVGTTRKQSKKIAVQVLRPNIDLSTKNDLYWMSDNRILSDVLLIKNRNVNDKLESKGVDSVVIGLDRWSIFQRSHLIYQLDVVLKFIATIGLYFRFIHLAIMIPEMRVLFPWCLKALIYKAVYEAYEVKVFTTATSHTDCAQVFGSNLAGVAHVRGCWSNQGYSHPDIASFADVVFAWGESTVQTFKKSGSKGVHYFIAGFIDSKLLSAQSGKSINCASELEDNGIRIVFFDNATGCDFPNSSADQRACYYALFELLRLYDDLHLIIKSKSGNSEELIKAGVIDRAEELAKEGRVTLLYGKRGYDNVPSSMIGKCDITIGYPISSAATELGIAGVYDIHVNLSSVREHLWECEYPESGKIIHSIEELKSRIMSIVECSRVPKYSTNESKVVNYYNDFNASSRMQCVIELLAYESEDEPCVRKKVEYAAKKYTEKYGNDSVVV